MYYLVLCNKSPQISRLKTHPFINPQFCRSEALRSVAGFSVQEELKAKVQAPVDPEENNQFLNSRSWWAEFSSGLRFLSPYSSSAHRSHPHFLPCGPSIFRTAMVSWILITLQISDFPLLLPARESSKLLKVSGHEVMYILIIFLS